ncbi:MAG: DUF3103 family protein [Massilia sp.]
MKLIVKALLGATVVLASYLNASAETVYGLSTKQAQPAAKPTAIDNAKRYGAWKVAAMLGDRQFAALVQRQFSGDVKSAMLKPVLDEYSGTSVQAKTAAEAMRSTDLVVRQQKAIAGDTDSVMEMTLYTPRHFAGKIDWKNLLVAYAPSGRKKTWTTVEAFDNKGASYRLDVQKAPSVPVLIVGLNRTEAHRAGIAVMNRHLQAAGLQKIAPMAKAGVAPLAANIETTKLTRVRLNNDEEPWISGAAEVYAIVSGVSPDQAKPTLTIVDMPYLDYDGTDYSPNQILIFWSDYRYAAANVQLFEHDDNTNYQSLAVALSQGVTAILGAFAPAYAVIGQVATAILQAMPANWFSNDDDYLDSFYTLEKGRSYTNYMGAAGNAKVSLEPYTLIGQ